MSGWRQASLRRVLSSLRDGTHGSFARTSTGVPLLSAKNISGGRVVLSGRESLISAQDYQAIHRSDYLRQGDVLLTVVGAIGRTAIFDLDQPVAFQRSVACLRPGPGLERRFLRYAIQATSFQRQLRARVRASAQPGIYLGELGSLKLALPALRTQRAIADRLDDKTTAIEALRGQLQRQLSLLAERRRALLLRALRRGLEPAASMQDSGVPWIGPMPAHWTLARLKRACLLQRGFDLPTQRRCAGHVPVMGGGGRCGWHDRAMANGPGVVIGRYGTLGRAHMVQEPFWPLNTALWVKRFFGNAPAYIRHLLAVLPVGMFAAKSAIPGLDRNDLHQIPVPLPGRGEQEVILRHLGARLAEQDRLAELLRHQRAGLHEYGQALVSAAVSGPAHGEEQAA